MITRERVLSVLQMRGPLIPVHIKKALGEGDTFIIGAVLTELKEAGKIRISNTKRGGSPYYYIPAHAAKLAEHIDDLGQKDARTARLLQEKKVLRDSTQDPLIRVSLRQIKDFAIPIEVTLPEGKEIFWKWYLLPGEQTEPLIKQALGIIEAEPLKEENTKAAAPEKQEEAEAKEAVQERSQATLPVQETIKKEPEPQAPASIPEPKKEELVEEKHPVPASKLLKEQDDTGDTFLKELLEYFASKHIQVITKNILRKNSDIEFEISVPSAVGRMEYFCKAKAKRKTTMATYQQPIFKDSSKITCAFHYNGRCH